MTTKQVTDAINEMATAAREACPFTDCDIADHRRNQSTYSHRRRDGHAVIWRNVDDADPQFTTAAFFMTTDGAWWLLLGGLVNAAELGRAL